MEPLTPVALREENAVFIGQERTSPEKRVVHRRSGLRKTLVLDNPQHLSSESDDDAPTMCSRASTSRQVFPTSTKDSEFIGNTITHLTNSTHKPYAFPGAFLRQKPTYKLPCPAAPATPDHKSRRSARIVPSPAQPNSIYPSQITPTARSPSSQSISGPLSNTVDVPTPKPMESVVPRRSMRLSMAISPTSRDPSSPRTRIRSPGIESHASQDEREVRELIISETPSPESAMPMTLHAVATGGKTPTRNGVPDLLGHLGSTPALFLVTATPEATTTRSPTRRRSSLKPALIDLRDQGGTDSMDVDAAISHPDLGDLQSVCGALENGELLEIGDQPDKDDAVPPTPSPRGSITPEVEPFPRPAPSPGRRPPSPLPFTLPSSPKPSTPLPPPVSPRPRRSLSPEKENNPTQAQETTPSSNLDEYPAPTAARPTSSVPILSRALGSTSNRRASLAIGTPATPDPAIGGRLRSLSPDTTDILHNILPPLQSGPSPARSPGPSILSTSKPRVEGSVSPKKSIRFEAIPEGSEVAKGIMDVDVSTTEPNTQHIREDDEEELTLPRGLSPPKIFGAISRLMFRPPPPKDDRPLAPLPNSSIANLSTLPFPIMSETKSFIFRKSSPSVPPAPTTSEPRPAAESVNSPKLATSSVPISQIPVLSPAKRSGFKPPPPARGLSQLRQPSALKTGAGGPGLESKIPRRGTKPYARPATTSKLPKPASKILSVTMQPQASTSTGAFVSVTAAPPSPAKSRRTRAMGLTIAAQQPLRQVSPPFSPGTVVDASQIIDLHSRFKATQQKSQQLPSVESVIFSPPTQATPVEREEEVAPRILDPYARLRDVTKKKLEAMASPPPMGIEDPVGTVTEEPEEEPEPVTKILDPSKRFRAGRQAQVQARNLPPSSPPLEEDEEPTVDPSAHSSPDSLNDAAVPLSTLPRPKPRDILRRSQIAINKPLHTALGRVDASFPSTAPAGMLLSGPSPALLKKSRKPPTKRSAATSVPGGLPADAAALRQLTSKHTEHNQVYAFSVVETQVILKEGKRPPSPTTRVKTILEKRKQDESGDKARGDRAARRAERREGGSLDGASEASGSAAASENGNFEEGDEEMPGRKHPRGPGEEEDYATPMRRTKRAREEVDSGSESDAGRVKKRVKWDKELQQRFEFVEDGNLDNVRKEAQAARTKPASKGILVGTVELDRMGNIPKTKLPPLPNLPKERIPVFKFVYTEDLPPSQRPKRTAAIAGRKAIANGSSSE